MGCCNRRWKKAEMLNIKAPLVEQLFSEGRWVGFSVGFYSSLLYFYFLMTLRIIAHSPVTRLRNWQHRFHLTDSTGALQK